MISLFGIRVRLHPLFVLVMAVAVITGYFLELITLFGIVIIHELGHIAAAKGLGWQVREVQLLPFGGVAVMDDRGRASAAQEIGVALAGPLQNVWMAGLGLALQGMQVWSVEWGQYFVLANVMIALFNLIPVLPLDGGKVAFALVSLWLPFHRTLWVCTLLSIFFSTMITILALSSLATSGIQMNLLLIGLFLIYSNVYTYRQLQFYFLRFLMNRDFRLSQMLSNGLAARTMVVRSEHKVGRIAKSLYRDRYHIICVLNEQGQMQGVVTEQRLLKSYFVENRPESAVSELIV